MQPHLPVEGDLLLAREERRLAEDVQIQLVHELSANYTPRTISGSLVIREERDGDNYS